MGYLTLGLLKEQIHTGQRAYVLVGKATLNQLLVAGQQSVVTLEFKNSGQTPAIDVSFAGEILIQADVPTISVTRAPNAYMFPIGAGEIAMPLYWVTPSQATVDDVAKKVKRVFLVGRIFYKDVFGKNNTTDFCLMYGDRLDMMLCDSSQPMK